MGKYLDSTFPECSTEKKKQTDFNSCNFEVNDFEISLSNLF